MRCHHVGENLRETILAELCPEGVWVLDETVKSMLRRKISGLPEREVSEENARCPQDRAGMRAYLETFFVRHFFQIQNSLVNYVASRDFEIAIRSGQLNILDIGSGPGVASLAISDMLGRTLLADSHGVTLHAPRAMRISHVLNDTSAICLGTARQMVADYTKKWSRSQAGLSDCPILAMGEGFPRNLTRISRVARAVGGFDIVFLSYVVRVLADSDGLNGVVNAIKDVGRFCKPHGRVLIVQDRFRESLLRCIARECPAKCNEQQVSQKIYPERGTCETNTYTYYDCLYAP